MTKTIRRPLAVILSILMTLSCLTAGIASFTAAAEDVTTGLIGRYFATDNVWFDSARGQNGIQWQVGDYPAYNSALCMTYFNGMYVRIDNNNLFSGVTRDTGLAFAFNYRPNFTGDHRHILSIGQNEYGNGVNNHLFIAGATSWYSDGNFPIVAWVNGGGEETIKAYPQGFSPVPGAEYNIVVVIDKDAGVVFYIDGEKKTTVYNGSNLNGQIGNVRSFLDEVRNYNQNYIGCSRWTADAKIEGYLSDLRIYGSSMDETRAYAVAADVAGSGYSLAKPTFNATAYHYSDPATGAYGNLAYSSPATTEDSGMGIRGADNSDDYKDIQGVYFKFFTPLNAVMVYDGAHETYTPIELETKRHNRSNIQDQRIYYVVSNSSLIKTRHNWYGYLDSAWKTWAGAYTANQINTDTSLDVYVGSTNDTPRFWWNAMKYTGTGNTETYYDHEQNISFTLEAFFDYTVGGTSKGTGTITTLSNYYVLNYKPIYNILDAAQALYTGSIAGQEWKYTEQSLAKALIALRRVSLCNPNYYDYANRGVDSAAQNSAAAIKQAVSNYNDINLVKKTAEITFANYNGAELQKTTYNYGDTPVYSGNQPAKPYDGDKHYEYAGWDSGISVVDGEKTYTAVFSGIDHEWQWEVDSAATCTAAGVKHEECACGAVRSENTAIAASGHTYAEPSESDWTWTKTADGYTAYVSLSCVRSDDDRDVVAVVGKTAETSATHLVDGSVTYTATATIGDQTFTATKTDVIKAEGHNLSATPAKAPTCTVPGNTAYWTCETCGKFFSDENGENEIEEDSWVLGANGHNLSATPAKDATCTAPGNTAYWTCETCGKFFSDENGVNEIEEDSWVLGANGHNLSATPAKDATCTAPGNTAYWTCETCGKFFSDENGVNEIEEDSWVLGTNGHNLSATPAKDATCTAPGNTAYWTCGTCGKFFSDENGVNEIEEDSWILNANGHSWNYAGASYAWNDDLTVCTATVPCSGCSETTEITATGISHSTTQSATCMAEGVETYTAAFEIAGLSATTTRPIAKDMTNHVGEIKTRNVNAVPGTCVDPATWTEESYCEACGNVTAAENKTGNTDPDNHATDETETRNAKDPGYTFKGYTGDKHCKACDEIVESGEDISKLDINENSVYNTAAEVLADASGYDPAAISELQALVDALDNALAIDDNEQAVLDKLDQISAKVAAMGASVLYTLTVDAANGSAATEKQGIAGSTADLGAPLKDGYKFKQWNVTAGSVNGTVYTFAETDATATAVYTVDTDAAVAAAEEIINNAGDYDDDYVAQVEAKLAELEEADPSDPANNDEVLRIIDELNGITGNADANRVYTVTFIVDGQTVKTEPVKAGGDATAPEQAQLIDNGDDHKVFSGWTGTYTDVTADVTVTASYTTAPHSWTDGDVILAATCMAAGSQKIVCGCGAESVKTLEIDPDNHTGVNATTEENVVPATCRNTGSYTEVVTCECGVVISRTEGKVKDIDPDAHQAGEPAVTSQAATCVDPGYTTTTVKCVLCGTTLSQTTEPIAPTGIHTPGAPETDTQPATCGRDGYTTTTVRCTVCQEVISQTTQTLTATGDHTAGDPVETVIRQATCTAEGEKKVTVKCTVCNQTISEETQPIPMTAHTLRHVEAKAPGCSTNGNIEYYVCTVCGKRFADAAGTAELTAAETVLPATGEHDLTYVPEKAPTATQDGHTEYWYCAECGGYFADEAGTRRLSWNAVRIPATGDAHDSGTGDCPYCGKSHNDRLYGWIIYLLHVIAYYFLQLVNMFR